MPSDTERVNLDDAIALHSIRGLAPEDMPRVAAEALVAGWDSPSLRALAGLDLEPFDPLEAAKLFHSVMREVGRRPPAETDALRVMFRKLGDEVRGGTRSPIDAARAAWEGFCKTKLHDAPEEVPADIASVYYLLDCVEAWNSYRGRWKRRSLQREIRDWFEFAASRGERPKHLGRVIGDDTEVS